LVLLAKVAAAGFIPLGCVEREQLGKLQEVGKLGRRIRVIGEIMPLPGTVTFSQNSAAALECASAHPPGLPSCAPCRIYPT